MFAHRLAWALYFLRRAGLLESPARGIHRITARGVTLLGTNPQARDLSAIATGDGLSLGNQTKPTEGDEGRLTPEERIEFAMADAEERLRSEMSGRLQGLSPAVFERTVLRLLLALGYGGGRESSGELLGRTADGGVDGLVREDKLGLERIYIQAKRWQEPVGRPTVQAFVGALQGQRATKGILITTSQFTQEAIDYAASIDYRIVLIDGDTLARLTVAHRVGTVNVATYQICRIDQEFFDD